MSENQNQADFVALAADIVSAYVAKNAVRAADLPEIIASVHSALSGLVKPAQAEEKALTPAVSVKKSVTPDFIVCLEDGKKFKSLKRHLRTAYNMTPDDYRAKWGLAADYPMVAPSYAAARSELAKSMGLGQQRRKRGPAKGRKAAVAA